MMMMVPIGLAVIYQTAELTEQRNPDIPTSWGEFAFGTALMLCIAYTASVGGVATLIGTPPNLIFAGAISELFRQTVSFVQWMSYSVPISVVGITIVYIYMTLFALEP